MKLIIFAAVLVLAFESRATISDRDWLTYGMGIGVNRSGDAMNLELSSKALGRYSFGGLTQDGRFGAVLGFHNLYLVQQVSQNFFTGVYFENRVIPAEAELIQAYSRIGILGYLLNANDFDESFGAGLTLAFGADCIIVSERKDALFGSGSSSFFVQVQGAFGLPQTSLGLEVLNGISLAVGLRNHF